MGTCGRVLMGAWQGVADRVSAPSARVMKRISTAGVPPSRVVKADVATGQASCRRPGTLATIAAGLCGNTVKTFQSKADRLLRYF